MSSQTREENPAELAGEEKLDDCQTKHTLTIEITVHDEEQLRAAALARAVEEGREPDDWLSGAPSISDCPIMLFDPGISPDGCQIENTFAEEHL